MSYIYKNIVIIERCNSNKDKLFNSLNIDFFDNKPFLYKNENDKLLLFYNKSYYNDTDYHILNDENINNYLNKSNIIGYVKLILDNLNVKITHFEGNHNELSNILNITKEYFCKTIKDIPDSKKNNIVDKAILYWDPSIFNNDIITLVKNLNLMSNPIQYYHKFSYADVYENTLNFSTTAFSSQSTTVNFGAPSISNTFSPQPSTVNFGVPSTSNTFSAQPSTVNFSAPSTSNTFSPQPSTVNFGAPSTSNTFSPQPSTVNFGVPSTSNTFSSQPTTVNFGAPSTTNTISASPSTANTFGILQPTNLNFGAPSTTNFSTQPTTVNFGVPSTKSFSTQNNTTTFGSTPINTFGIQSTTPFGNFKSSWSKT